MKCPSCGRETQYNTGLCEWCGADLFPQHQRPAPAHLPDAPPTTLCQLRQANVREYWIGGALSGLGTVMFIGGMFASPGRYGRPALVPAPPEAFITMWVVGLIAMFIGSYFLRLSRKTRICSRCGGIMMLEDTSLMWGTMFFSRHVWRRYTYFCTACHDVASIMR
jgi:hypothetical protein